VLKDTKPHPWAWRDPNQWRRKRPREIRIHEEVDRHRTNLPLAERRNLVQAYSYRVMMHRRRYRIMLRYYPGGDLETALGWTQKFTARYQYRTNGPLPESFIWHVLQSLVKAVRALQRGTFDPNYRTVMPHWKPITHLDINLRNIFLGQRLDLKTPVSWTSSRAFVNLVLISRKSAPTSYCPTLVCHSTR
jgi:serine/threonine protein kinase